MLSSTPSGRLRTLSAVQQGLFDQPVEIDYGRDPYVEERMAARTLAGEFAIGEREAFDIVLCHGSEEAARRALLQRWWRGEVELREVA
jgi:hypothetical protein